MRRPACSEADITRLVHGFYAKVRADPALGPVFDRQVADWDAHLARLVDFWSALLRGTARFEGSPMRAHAALPGLTQPLFERWLALFHVATQELGNDILRGRADLMARRMAAQLWQGYRRQH